MKLPKPGKMPLPEMPEQSLSEAMAAPTGPSLTVPTWQPPNIGAAIAALTPRLPNPAQPETAPAPKKPEAEE